MAPVPAARVRGRCSKKSGAMSRVPRWTSLAAGGAWPSCCTPMRGRGGCWGAVGLLIASTGRVLERMQWLGRDEQRWMRRGLRMQIADRCARLAVRARRRPSAATSVHPHTAYSAIHMSTSLLAITSVHLDILSVQNRKQSTPHTAPTDGPSPGGRREGQSSHPPSSHPHRPPPASHSNPSTHRHHRPCIPRCYLTPSASTASPLPSRHFRDPCRRVAHTPHPLAK